MPHRLCHRALSREDCGVLPQKRCETSSTILRIEDCKAFILNALRFLVKNLAATLLCPSVSTGEIAHARVYWSGHPTSAAFEHKVVVRGSRAGVFLAVGSRPDPPCRNLPCPDLLDVLAFASQVTRRQHGEVGRSQGGDCHSPDGA